MKALVKSHAKPGLWLEDVPKPTVGPNDVLIKIKKTAICSTDIHIYNWDNWAQKTIPVPLTTGHEFMGTIEEVGEQVNDLAVGQRVSGEGHLVCHRCRPCQTGRAHLCRYTKGIGVNTTGAFAEYLTMPQYNVYPLPDSISDDVGACLDPFGNATHTALSFSLVGEDVLITGAGPIGIMAVAIAKHAGAHRVVVTDVNPYRLALATKMGATHAIDVRETSLSQILRDLNLKEGFSVGMEMSGHPDAFRSMIHHTDYGAKVALLGIPPNEMTLDWNDIIFKGLTFKGIYGREMFNTWRQMIALVEAGLDITPIITHQFGYDEFEEGFSIMREGNSGKVILNWQ